MDDTPSHLPATLSSLRAKARDAGFIMSSEDRTGSLLAALAAARPAEPGWPEGHDASVERLLAELQEREDFRCVRLAWASGLLMAVRTA